MILTVRAICDNCRETIQTFHASDNMEHEIDQAFIDYEMIDRGWAVEMIGEDQRLDTCPKCLMKINKRINQMKNEKRGEEE